MSVGDFQTALSIPLDESIRLFLCNLFQNAQRAVREIHLPTLRQLLDSLDPHPQPPS